MGKIGYLREKKGKKKYLFNFNFFNMAGRGRGRGALLIKAQDKLPGGLPGHPLVKKVSNKECSSVNSIPVDNHGCSYVTNIFIW